MPPKRKHAESFPTTDNSPIRRNLRRRNTPLEPTDTPPKSISRSKRALESADEGVEIVASLAERTTRSTLARKQIYEDAPKQATFRLHKSKLCNPDILLDETNVVRSEVATHVQDARILSQGSDERISLNLGQIRTTEIEAVPPPIAKRRGRPGQIAVAEEALTAPHIEQDPAPDNLDVTPSYPPLSPSEVALCLAAQKQSILCRIHCRTLAMDDLSQTQQEARTQLLNLLDGTVSRAEGNSCLVLGPRGSGKSLLVQQCLDSLEIKPIILRLSGVVQLTDKSALRELAVQLLRQTGSRLLLDTDVPNLMAGLERASLEEENPFLEPTERREGSALRLPPSSQMHTLISALSSLNLPVIIILESFDLFALHPRQSLLYCLLDSVQNCRASSDSNGIAVIGLTSRVDTVQLLEKRVKSRFSGRTLRLAPPNDLTQWMQLAKSILSSPLSSDPPKEDHQVWQALWNSNIKTLFDKTNTLQLFNDTFAISRDVRTLNAILASAIIGLNVEQPYLTYNALYCATEQQRSRQRFSSLPYLTYPSLCLLVASMHAYTAGHPVFSFEMLQDSFRNQVRASASAPVQLKGNSVGMVRCSREVLWSSFEQLVLNRMFIPVANQLPTTAKEFGKYRCALERESIRKAIEKSGQINLKKWLAKSGVMQ